MAVVAVLNTRPQALYVHIPFCRSKCGYCDFYSVAENDPSRLEAYPRLALAELASLSARFRDGDFNRDGSVWTGKFDTLFIGGGTPSVLPPKPMETLLSGLSGYLGALNGNTPEWTVECNPESLTESALELFEEYGVTRLSLGIQSLEDTALAAAGRAGSLEDSLSALDLLSRRWKGEWNADLICGLPGQNPGGPGKDARRIADNGASHISLYALTLEEGTPFHSRAAREKGRGGSNSGFLPSAPEAEAMWFGAAEALDKAGFARYEVSNFCRPGKECRHNLHYWNIDAYFGVGPGAVSTLLMGGGRSLRRSIRKDVHAYLGADGGHGAESLAEYEEMGPLDSLKDYLLMSLRTKSGARADTLTARFGLTPVDIENALRETGNACPGLAFDDRGLRLDDAALDRLNSTLLRLFEAAESLPI